jgi:hypothetical protein
MEPLHIVLDKTIGVCDPVMLTQRLHPGGNKKGFDHAFLIRSIFKDSPMIGAISAAFVAQLLDSF